MSLFGKKSPAPAQTRVKPAPSLEPIAITGLGLSCHAGDQPFALITSILGQINGVRLSNEYSFKAADGSKEFLPRMAPAVELEDMYADRRMYTLTSTALMNAAAQISVNVKPESVLIVIMIDPELLNLTNGTDQQQFQSYLMDGIGRFAPATFRILFNTSASSSSALRTSLAELTEGKWQAVIFGGADSLISIEACQKLHRDNRLNVVGKREGIVPGEGAAFVVLQSKESAANNTTPALGYLRGLGVAAEPHARDADIEATEGLTSAINQALAQASLSATDIQGIVHGLGAETVQALEWYKTTQQIWPRRVSEQQRMAVQMGEIERADTPDDPIPKIILPYMTMGYVGAAALPIQLATALAWIEYDASQARWGFPIRNHILVCDTPDAPERGALVISPTLAASGQ